MKYYAILSLFAILALGVNQSALGQKLIISTGEWPPWVSQSLPEQGLLAKIIKQAYASQGVDVSFKFTSWYNTTTQLDEGDVDASFPWYENRARKNKYLYSAPLINSQTVLFTRKAYPTAWLGEFKHLNNMRIGASGNYSYGKLFKHFERTQGRHQILRIKTAQPDYLNLKKLLNHEIDVFPIDIDIANYLLKTFFSERDMNKLSYHPHVIYEKPMYLITRRNHSAAKHITKLNAGLSELGQEAIQKIISAERFVMPFSRKTAADSDLESRKVNNHQLVENKGQ